MKIFRKPQKNICKNSVFLTFCGYIYNQMAKTVDLPAFIGIFTGLIYAKESSHVGASADNRRCLK